MGVLYHASKSEPDKMTKARSDPKHHDRLGQSYKTEVEVAPNVDIAHDELKAIVEDVAKNRRFVLIKNNCQRFVTEVLDRLVKRGKITKQQVKALPKKGFRPIIPKRKFPQK
ncbi:hypothetical protein AJ79_07662 [Helicocarpus griseus UAMH5409]|uniref:Uncharacterized protein n=1 Tax=Helicocarpus griseus UAMH5409 TaxID=1447875 RepID=A0A2B7X0K5_9EURO|nr:hypothetical protein AJ79_07662 [Helicocarpus griseus UAMH5409]